MYVRPFWPPGGPALRANVAGRIGVESDYSCYYAIYIVVRICSQTSKVRTKADTAMNSDETSHPDIQGDARGSVAQLNLMSKGTPGFAEEENVRGNVELPKAPNTERRD